MVCVVCLLTPIYTKNNNNYSGHGVISGMFIYILLIDIFPMIEEGHLESHQHHPHLGPKKTHSSSIHSDIEHEEANDIKSYKISPKIVLPFFFVLCFGTTSTLICCKTSFESMLNKWF